MEGIKIHYGPDQPARLKAHAEAHETGMPAGSGPEQHLPHERWHVVQQDQGRVKGKKKAEAAIRNDDPLL